MQRNYTVSKLTNKYQYVKVKSNYVENKYQFIYEFSFNEGLDVMFIEHYISKIDFLLLEERNIVSDIIGLETHNDLLILKKSNMMNKKVTDLLNIILPDVNYDNFDNNYLSFVAIKLFYYDDQDKWELLSRRA